MRRLRIALVPAAVSAGGIVVALLVGRATGANWLPAMALAVLFGVGLYLWAVDSSKSWGDLGQGILVSVVVATALTAVQRDADERIRAADERRAEQVRAADAHRQRDAERQSLQLTLTLRPNLNGIALPGRDMTRILLSGKSLREANLRDALLEDAELGEANLRGADIGGARFDGANLVSGILRETEGREPVSFRGATMIGASFLNAILERPDFRDADLRLAYLGGTLLDGADFRGANLEGAYLCGIEPSEVKLEGATYDSETTWPPGVEPDEHGAREVEGGGYGDGGDTSERDIRARVPTGQYWPGPWQRCREFD